MNTQIYHEDFKTLLFIDRLFVDFENHLSSVFNCNSVFKLNIASMYIQHILEKEDSSASPKKYIA